MFNGMMSASLENVIETNNVRFDISVGMINTVTDAGLGGEVDDDIWMMLGEDLIDKFFVGEVAFDESKVTELL